MSLLLALSSSGGTPQPNRLWYFKTVAAVALGLLAIDEVPQARAATVHDFRAVSVSAPGHTTHAINQVVLVDREDSIVHVDHARKFQPFRQYPVAAPPTVGAPWYLWKATKAKVEAEEIEFRPAPILTPFRNTAPLLATTTYTIDIPDLSSVEWTEDQYRQAKHPLFPFRQYAVTAQAGQPWYLWKPRQTQVEPEADFQRFNYSAYVRQIVATTQPGQPFFSWKRTLAAPEAETYTVPPTSLFVLTRVTIETITPPSSGADDYIVRSRHRGRR